MANQPAKVFIKIETPTEQQEHLRSSSRKTLKVLQKAATDKENLVGRPTPPAKGIYKSKADSETELTELAKRKKLNTRGTQTDSLPSTASDELSKPRLYGEDTKQVIKDLTSKETPSEGYWEKLAEKRREALHETLGENQRLHERIEGLEAELETSRQMLDEARSLVETLTEMLEEAENPQETKPDFAIPSTSLNSTGCSKVSLGESAYRDSSDED